MVSILPSHVNSLLTSLFLPPALFLLTIPLLPSSRDWPKGTEFDVYSENDLNTMLYRIRSFFRVPFAAEIVDKSTNALVGTVNKLLRWRHDFLFNVQSTQGTISKCRFCFSRQWTVRWGQQPQQPRTISVQGDVFGHNYQFFNEQGQVVGSMSYQWHPIRKDEWRLVATDPTLPDAFYLTVLSAINDGS